MDQHFFRTPFAINGNQTPIDNDPQPDGTVSFDLGYTFDYERELGVDPLAKAIERQKMNSLLFQITEALAQYQSAGIPEWITTANNGGVPFPYDVAAVVKYRALPADPWDVYDSLVAGNTSTPGTDPNKWRIRSYERPGMVAMFAMSAVPPGWLRCNGQAVSRTTYPLLFAAIGVTYGAGDGSTTFNVPDMRGEFPRGLDEGRGVDAGRTLGSFQGGAIQSHNHYLPTSTGTPPGNTSRGIDDNAFLNTAINNSPAGGVVSTTFPNANYIDGSQVGNVGTFADETRPRNIAMPYCIKV